MYYKIYNLTKDVTVIEKAKIASSFFSRLKGFMFQKPSNTALIFYNAPSIHTFFMRFCLDIVFLDKDFKVIKIYRNLKPSRLVNCFGSRVTIEIPTGLTPESFVDIGDFLKILPVL